MWKKDNGQSLLYPVKGILTKSEQKKSQFFLKYERKQTNTQNRRPINTSEGKNVMMCNDVCQQQGASAIHNQQRQKRVSTVSIVLQPDKL